jgi:hypothetical protein
VAEYDEIYGNVQDFFGAAPDSLLTRFYRWIDLASPVLDIGAGQGRHTLFLARKGFTVDAIDLSEVSIRTVSELASREHLRVKTYHCGFSEFSSEGDVYSGVLLFGLLQILCWEEIGLLKTRLDGWTENGSLLLVTAFTTDDPSYEVCSKDWKQIGKNSYEDPHSEVRTFLESGEVTEVFEGYRVLHHWEGMGPEHRHGENPPHRHGRVEAVFEKQEPKRA